MTDLDTRRPEFTAAIRGYDRLQVDDYIERLQQMAAEAEERARAAEASREDTTHTEIGPRVTQIFELATAEAREVREAARREAEELRTRARRDAKAIVDGAEENAQRKTQDATRDHKAMIAEFEHERERMRDEVHALEERRNAVLGELRRLHETLGSASGLVGAATDGATDSSEVPTRRIRSARAPRELTDGERPKQAPSSRNGNRSAAV